MKWIILTLLPALMVSTVLPFDDSAIEKIFQQRNPALFLFVADQQAETGALSAFNQYDATNPQLLLTLSTKNDGHGFFQSLAQYLGVNTTDTTPKVLYLGAQADKYNYNHTEITAETLASFVSQVQSGQVEQFFKSGPIPEFSDDVVKVVVGETFKEIVLDSQHQFLIKFYSPECSRSKNFAQVFDEVARRLIRNTNIVFAEIDSTENDVPDVEVYKFPVIKFWGRNKSFGPKEYFGDRNADAIIEWLHDHTTYEWVQPIEFEEESIFVEDESLHESELVADAELIEEEPAEVAEEEAGEEFLVDAQAVDAEL